MRKINPDRLHIHEYGRVDLVILKDVIEHDLPDLKQQFQKLLTLLPS